MELINYTEAYQDACKELRTASVKMLQSDTIENRIALQLAIAAQLGCKENLDAKIESWHKWAWDGGQIK